MWLLIIVLTTLGGNNNIKAVDLELAQFETRGLCEQAMRKVRLTLVDAKVIHTVQLDYRCAEQPPRRD